MAVDLSKLEERQSAGQNWGTLEKPTNPAHTQEQFQDYCCVYLLHIQPS